MTSEDGELWSLPDGWEWAPFGTVAAVASNLVDPSEFSAAPHIAPNHIESGTGRLLPYTTIAADKVKSAKHRFFPGHILYSKIRPYLCKAVRVDFEGLCSADMYPVATDIDPEYLLRWMLSPAFTSMASNHDTRTLLPKINQEALALLSVPVPPLAEQGRIVAAVERLLDAVSSARARLERVPALLKRLRQSVLAAACSGRLTADWRQRQPELESAPQLLAALAAKRGVTTPCPQTDELPEGWANTTIGFLTEWTPRGRPFITSGSRGWAKLVGRVGRYFIRSENINTDHLRLDEAVRVDAPEGSEADRTQVRDGDLLLTITGNNVGRTAVVPSGCPVAHVSQHVAIIRIERTVNVNYLWLWLRSEQHGKAGLEHYGETKPGRNLEQIREHVVDLPPLAEQAEIVRRVSALFAHADALERRAAAALRRVEGLTPAVLAKAFRGELVPTEAELARREGRTYEPAADLLARIRAAAPAAPKPRRGRKPTP